MRSSVTRIHISQAILTFNFRNFFDAQDSTGGQDFGLTKNQGAVTLNKYICNTAEIRVHIERSLS